MRSFRDAVLADAGLASAEFTAGRGIAQAMHHWRSTAIGALLLEAGAEIDVLTTRHETPLAMQVRFGTVEGTRFLLERGASPNLGTIKVMPSSSMGVLVELLQEHGWDINEGAGRRTLLHHDANHGHGEKVRLLLDHGADPNARDAERRADSGFRSQLLWGEPGELGRVVGLCEAVLPVHVFRFEQNGLHRGAAGWGYRGVVGGGGGLFRPGGGQFSAAQRDGGGVAVGSSEAVKAQLGNRGYKGAGQ